MSIGENDGRTGRIRGLPYWIWRHLGVIAFSAIATYLFMESRAEWIAMHRWNRALADTSLVLVALALAAGPLARLWPAAAGLLPWRREAGIYGVALGFALNDDPFDTILLRRLFLHSGHVRFGLSENF